MAGKIRGLFSKIGQFLLGKKPPKLTKPNLLGGRGIAVGSVAKRKQRLAQGLPEFTDEEIQKWRTLSPEEVDGFLDLEQPLFVHSSNVAMVQFFPVEGKMMVEFKNGGAYMVSPISKDEAQSFVTAQSKGGWYWTNVRVRGTKHGHRKNVVKIR